MRVCGVGKKCSKFLYRFFDFFDKKCHFFDKKCHFLTKSVIFGTFGVLGEKKEGKILFIFLWNWVKVVSQGVSPGGYLGRDLPSKPCYPGGLPGVP